MPISCPYCNAPMPVPNPSPANGRVICPRCEEMVTVRGEDAGASPMIVAAPPIDRTKLTNRTVAGIVVAVMFGMAALGLFFALHTVGVRRANDTKGAQAPEPVPEAVALAPVAWPGLGYLPDDVQAVAGIRVAEALDSPAGRALLGTLKLADGKKATILGIAPGNVDQLVFGASLRTLPPRVTAVVHGSIGEAPSPDRTTEHHGKRLQRLKLWATGPEGLNWRADRHTLVAAVLPEDFDHIPAQPRTLVPLSELLTERLDSAALAWLAAKIDANNPAFAFVTPFLPPADRDAWTKLDALTVSIRAEGLKLSLLVQLRGKDAAAGEAIAKAVAESLTKAGVAADRKSDGDWQKLIVTADPEKLAAGMRPK